MAHVPQRMQQFVSSSRQTIIEYYGYDSGLCTPGFNCDFRDVITVPSGFEQVEVFLSGFRLSTDTHEDTVERITVTVQKHRYIMATGELELSVRAHLLSGKRQNYLYRITFVIVLTGSNVAKFTPVGGSCRGIGQCSLTKPVLGAIPAGMHFIGLATSNWEFGSDSGPLKLNSLSGHINALTINGPDVNIDYLSVLEDASRKKRMFFEWGAHVIAFHPTEMAQHGGSLFPQYTFQGMNATNRQFWTEHSASTVPIRGFLNAFEGLSLFDPSTLGFPPLVDKPIWMIESSSEKFAVHPFSPHTALTTYGIFLGTQFGNISTTAPFGFQESRAFGFLV